MTEPGWVPLAAPFPSLGPRFPSYKTLTAPAMSTSHPILTITLTEEESKAQRAWDIWLRSHSQEVAELGSKPRPSWLPQQYMPPM